MRIRYNWASPIAPKEDSYVPANSYPCPIPVVFLSTHVYGIEFRTCGLRKHRDAARGLAIQAAREKAIALAGELGQEVGRPIDIREEYKGW
jgi:Protein of unknown function (DUF541)